MSRLLDRLEQVKKLKNGAGIQSLLDSASKILGNPIVMFNTEYKLLAYTNANTDDPIWNEIITCGTFSEETRRFFENEGFIEEIGNAPRVAVMTSDKLKYSRMNGKVFNKNHSYVSNLITVESNRPFEEEDPIVFDAICKLISREVSKSEIYQEYEQTHQETIIRNLIDGNCDRKLDMGQVGILYDSLESHLYTVVVDISQCAPGNTGPAHFRDMLMRLKPAYKYAVYSGYIIIIASTDDDALQVNKGFCKLSAFFEQNNLYAGISSRFENLFELQKYYAEALQALQYVLESKSNQRIFPCSEGSMEKMEQIKKVENGKGIQYFLDIGPEIFGNPLLFHDLELNLLAYSENVEILDPIWQELIKYGTSSDETIKLFETEGFINKMEHTKGGALLVSEKIKYDRISWRIYNNDNIMIGCLCLVESARPFTEDELVLFGAFSQTFSKEVGKLEFYNNYGQVYSGTVINRLIGGTLDRSTFYSEDIGNLYDSLMDNIYLLVVDTAQCDLEHINLVYFRNLFNRFDTVNRYAIYSNTIIIIISTDNTSFNENNELTEINSVFAQNRIYAGISRRFGNIYELRRYYNEAIDALNHGLQNKEKFNGRHIFQYDEAGLCKPLEI